MRLRRHLGLLAALAALVCFCSPVQCFYLPGVAPQDFKKKDPVVLKVNKLTSIKTQLPYPYYSLPYCRPDKVVQSAENLGEVLRGDRIENSLFQINMRVDEQCKVLCRIEALTAEQAQAFQEKIDDDYKVNMIMDNLPVAVARSRKDEAGGSSKTYERGFYVGAKLSLEAWAALGSVKVQEGEKAPKYFLHNHLRFSILYHKDPATDLSRIVGFEVEPFSVKHEYEAPWDGYNTVLNTCNPGRAVAVSRGLPPQPVQEGAEVIFTYDVKFVVSDIRWSTRWDTYWRMTDDHIHWFSIVNSAMIVLFLSGMVAMIMLRTLHRDISKYNELEAAEEAAEETGWKLVHGDVFRPPVHTSLLATFVGTGVQLLGMTLVTMTFALLGFLSPANRGGLMTATLLLFVFCGVFGGYFAGRLYKSWRGDRWRQMTVRTALLFPGVVSVIFFTLDCMIWSKKSSAAVPFSTLFSLCFLWFGVNVPLVFLGSYFGFKKPPPEDPVRTNKIPRQVPEQPWYMSPVFSCLVGGVLPFGAVFIELFFILTSIWLHQLYYLFGFLALVFIILVITCAEITMVLVYFQLCAEDYKWQWRSYITSGSSALYLFTYSVYYFYSRLDITKVVPMLMYFGYMSMISLAFFCLTGAIGFYSAWWFVRKIYSAIKID